MNQITIPSINHFQKYSKSPEMIPISQLYTLKKDINPSKKTISKRSNQKILPSPNLPSISTSPHIKYNQSSSPLKPIYHRYKSPQTEVPFSTLSHKKRYLNLSFEQRPYVSPSLRTGKSLKTITETPEPVLLRKHKPEFEIVSKQVKEKPMNKNPYIKKLDYLIGSYKETQQWRSYLYREMFQRQKQLNRSYRGESPMSEIEGIPISLTPLPDISSLLPNSII